MLDTIILESYKRRLNPTKKGNKLGKCVLCGERVRTNQNYITTEEGYTHKKCLRNWREN